MKALRTLVAVITMLAFTGSAFASEFQDSAVRAVQREAQTQAAPAGRSGGSTLVWPGAGLVAVGMGLTLWGLLHTSDGDYVTPIDVSKTSNPKMVGAGLALVGAGGALLFFGSERARRLPTVTFGKQGIGASKTVSW